MANTALAAQIGERIRKLRNERGWLQRDLATRAGIVNASMISYYELGERCPSYDTLLRLADVFRVTTDYILRGGTGRQIAADGLDDEAIGAVLTIIERMQQNK